MIERPGSVVGIENGLPSLKLGMNSEPSFLAGQTEATMTATASPIVNALAFRTALITAR